MNEEQHPRHELPEPGARHEKRDVHLSGILWFAVGLLVTAVVIHAALLGLFNSFETSERRQQRVIPMAGEGPTLPPQPRLEGLDNLEKHKNIPASEKQGKFDSRILNTYGWINQKEGVVRVPIKRAMELLERKLKGKERGRESQMPSGGMPGRASSGRLTEKKP